MKKTATRRESSTEIRKILKTTKRCKWGPLSKSQKERIRLLSEIDASANPPKACEDAGLVWTECELSDEEADFVRRFARKYRISQSVAFGLIVMEGKQAIFATEMKRAIAPVLFQTLERVAKKKRITVGELIYDFFSRELAPSPALAA